MASSHNTPLSEFRDRVVITPSESIFNQEQWDLILRGTSKDAGSKDRSSAREILAKKFPPKPKSKPGPKSREPADKARHLRQNYLWMMRELLRDEDGKDEDVCTKACLIIHNFDRLCRSGVFLRGTELHAVRSALSELKSEELQDDDGFFATELSRQSQQVGSIASGSTLAFLKKGRIIWSDRARKKPRVDKSRVSVLMTKVLPVLLNFCGTEFQVCSGNRIRTQASGRPPHGTDSWMKIVGADKSKVRYNLENQYRKKFGNDENSLTKVAGQTDLPSESLNPPPNEEEVLRKTVSRLALVQHLLRYRIHFPLSGDLSDMVLKYQREEWISESKPVQSVCDLLWDAGRCQPMVPWDDVPANEDSGRLVNVPLFGLLELDP